VGREGVRSSEGLGKGLARRRVLSEITAAVGGWLHLSSVVVPATRLEARAVFKRARYETLAAERRALLDLRDRNVIGDEVLLDLDQELDVEAARHGLAGYDTAEAKGGWRRPGVTVGEDRS
ncbi:MAG: hypothetical protein ACREMB_22750, partial [Candidatus Rokuibacteriota bacterium]